MTWSSSRVVLIGAATCCLAGCASTKGDTVYVLEGRITNTANGSGVDSVRILKGGAVAGMSDNTGAYAIVAGLSVRSQTVGFERAGYARVEISFPGDAIQDRNRRNVYIRDVALTHE